MTGTERDVLERERVEKIREVAEAYQFQSDERGWLSGACRDLLDERSALRAERDRYREALEDIADMGATLNHPETLGRMQGRARRALEADHE